MREAAGQGQLAGCAPAAGGRPYGGITPGGITPVGGTPYDGSGAP